MEYYSATKRSQVLTHAATWMNLENITLSKRSQSQKITYRSIPFMWNVLNTQIYGDRKWIDGCQLWGSGEATDNRYRVSLRGFVNVLELDSVGSCTTLNVLEITESHWIYTLNGWILEYVNCISIKLLHFFKRKPSMYAIFSSEFQKKKCWFVFKKKLLGLPWWSSG